MLVHLAMRRILIATSLLAVALTATLLSQSKPLSKDKAASKSPTPAAPAYGNADSISQEEMKIYLYFLASDQLEGRNLPSRGFDTAALYVASHLAEWGLKPGGSTTGTNGPLQPYFMPFELVTKQVVPAESKASLTAPAPPAGRGGFGGDDAGAGAPAAGAGQGGGRRGGNAEPR